MDPKLQQPTTAFIPKQPLTKERVVPTSQSGGGFLSVIAVFFLIVSIALAGATYVYRFVTLKAFAEKRAQIEQSQDTIDTKFIDEIKELDKRIKASNQVLSNHIILSPLFEALGGLTLKSVQYTKFEYRTEQSDKGETVLVTMSGLASSYKSIALQSEKLAENKNIQNPIFSNLQKADKSGSGLVQFDLTFSVNPAFLRYSEVSPTEPVKTQ